jgi:protein SCO1/2
MRLGPLLQQKAAALVARPLFWIALIALVVAVPVAQVLGRDVPRPPALQLPLPPFSLTRESGERFGSEDLRGRVWIADFVFTSCPLVCPKLTKRMAEIQYRGRHLGEALRLVSFTVDPENDTPEVLAAYARSYHAKPNRWIFLTGPLGDVETTVVKGFKLAMGKEETAPGLFAIFHGERLVLVDQAGAIRGYYEADDEGVTQILRDAGILANMKDPPSAEVARQGARRPSAEVNQY